MERAHIFETVIVIALIVLVGILCIAVLSPTSPATTGWEMQGNGIVDYMFSGSDDTLYVFQGNNVTAIKDNGRIAWSLRTPDEWSPSMSSGNWGYHPAAGEKDGHLYMLLSRPSSLKETARHVYPGSTFIGYTIDSEIMAISPDGTVSWTYPFTGGAMSWAYESDSGYRPSDEPVIEPHGDRVLVYHDQREDVLDDGKLLFSISNVSGPVAVDSGGRMYAVAAAKPDLSAYLPLDFANGTYFDRMNADPKFQGENTFRIVNDPTYMIKTSVVKAFSADGTPLWSSDIGEKVVYTYDNFGGSVPVYGTLPLLVGDTLYVPVGNGTAALDPAGNVKWITHLTGGTFYPFVELPVDDDGNVYMMPNRDIAGYRYVYSIRADGTVAPDPWKYDLEDVAYTTPAARSDGTVYVITNSSMYPLQAFNDTEQDGQMPINTLTAFDIKQRQALWSFTVPAEDVHRITVSASNIDAAIPGGGNSLTVSLDQQPRVYNGQPADEVSLLPMQDHRITINPGKNVVYLSYYSLIIESPVVFNRSRAAYVNSLYALDNNGTLLWEQPIDGYVIHTVVGNDTFYYNTDKGKIGGNKVNIAASIALAALAYVFLRFFMLGTISRARTRIDQNENRNVVLRHIIANPGVTATDLARDLSVNIGTIRYHLFILTMNHKVITHRADNKYLRYFTNAGTYTKEEQSLMALLRRKPLWETLRAVAEKPGLSGPELAEKLNVSTTAAHRDLTMLSQKGIIAQVQGIDRGHGYVIRGEQRERIEKAMELLRPKEG